MLWVLLCGLKLSAPNQQHFSKIIVFVLNVDDVSVGVTVLWRGHQTQQKRRKQTWQVFGVRDLDTVLWRYSTDVTQTKKGGVHVLVN